VKHIVKRAGHTELYDNRKLYASIYAAALAVREPAGSAELIAKEVVDRVEEWLGSKHEVTSNDIRVQAAKHLKAINEHAAFQYKHHRIVW
jgi:transcriptional regulator NrdR family protein